MNIKMATNSQLSTTESKKNKQTKQIIRTETESQMRTLGWWPVGMGNLGEWGER